jgi:hypothetical protein
MLPHSSYGCAWVRVCAGRDPFPLRPCVLCRHPLAVLSYTPSGPPADGVITCGSYDKPDYGCMAEARDSAAAYLQALLYVLNGTDTYALNSMKVVFRWHAPPPIQLLTELQ